MLFPFSEVLVEKLTGTVMVQPFSVLVRKIGDTPVLQICVAAEDGLLTPPAGDHKYVAPAEPVAVMFMQLLLSQNTFAGIGSIVGIGFLLI